MNQHTGPEGRPLLPVASLEEFFRDSVDAALAANHVIVGCDTSCYVVRLLTLFARADACHEPGAGARHRPLALMLADALDAPTSEERAVSLQRLGDVALFTAGFFAETLRDRAVGLDYYVNMGGGAYRALATGGRSSPRIAALAAIFGELAAKFMAVVDVLNEVRDCARGTTSQDVLRLYETWACTGSARAGRLLRQAGVEPSQQARSPRVH